MNIGIVTTWFERGAAYVSKQFEEVLSSEHNVFIYARGGESFAKGDPKWDTPNVFWSQHPVNIRYIDKKEIQKWVKNNKIEIVLFNEQNTFQPIIWFKELGVKTVAYIDYYTEITIPFFNVYDAVICNTKRHLSAFENHPNAIYIPWGTDTDVYKPVSGHGELVENGKVVFFNSAGMNPLRKGTDTFIRALEKCRGNKNVKGLIHSQKDLRKFFPRLSSTIDALIKDGVLEIVEKTITAPGLYYKADVYVYPSILDGIGLTVPEAISSGLACIVSDNPPMNEFINEEFGKLIPIKRLYSRADGYYWPQCKCDDEALAKILDDLASAPQNVIEMKVKARKYAEKDLSFMKNAEILGELLESVQLNTLDSGLRDSIDLYDNTLRKRAINFIIRYKLYRLPIRGIRKLVGYHQSRR